MTVVCTGVPASEFHHVSRYAAGNRAFRQRGAANATDVWPSALNTDGLNLTGLAAGEISTYGLLQAAPEQPLPVAAAPAPAPQAAPEQPLPVAAAPAPAPSAAPFSTPDVESTSSGASAPIGAIVGGIVGGLGAQQLASEGVCMLPVPTVLLGA